MKVKPCSSQQVKAQAGLTALALFIAMPTSELPDTWSLVLAAGQVVGLALAELSALKCFYTQQSGFGGGIGIGKVCVKCDLSVCADTYHCEICSMCVAGQSHHSDWLNCCIGARNAIVYLSCLAGLALAALCQIAAVIALYAQMLSSKDFALYIGQKYSLNDQGSLFHLFLSFSLLVSASVAIACCSNFSFHLCKLLSLWRQSSREKRTGKVSPVYNEETLIQPSRHKQSLDFADATFGNEKQTAKAEVEVQAFASE